MINSGNYSVHGDNIELEASGWCPGVGSSPGFAKDKDIDERDSVFNARIRNVESIRNEILSGWDFDDEDIFFHRPSATNTSPRGSQGTGSWAVTGIPDWHKDVLVGNGDLTLDGNTPKRDRSEGYFNLDDFKLRSPLSPDTALKIDNMFFHVGNVTSGKATDPSDQWGHNGTDYDPYTDPFIITPVDDFVYPPIGFPSGASGDFEDFEDTVPPYVNPTG